MKKLLESILIFAVFCALPFFGLWLTRLAYEFKTDDGFAALIAISIFIGLIASILNYEN